MSVTTTVARDEIYGLFKTAWDGDVASSSVLVLYENVPGEPPDAVNTATGKLPPYARVSVRHFTGGQSTLSGGLGRRTFSRNGAVTVQIFTPIGDGLALSDTLVPIARNAYEGVDTASGVWFRNVRHVEVGPTGAWYQVNVIADFTYDEIR